MIVAYITTVMHKERWPLDIMSRTTILAHRYSITLWCQQQQQKCLNPDAAAAAFRLAKWHTIFI